MEEEFVGGPVRARLIDVASRFGFGEERRHQFVQVPAGHVGQTLGNLTYCIEDYELAQTAYQSAWAEQMALHASWGEGHHRLTGDEMAIYRRAGDSHFRLQFRVDAFYLFARIMLDDIAAFLDALLAPSATMMGKHSGVLKHIRTIGAEKSIDVSAVVQLAQEAGDRIKPFRDDYIVHRSAKKLRVVRGLQVTDDGRARVAASGVMYPREGELPMPVVADDPSIVLEALNAYLDAVLDVADGLGPPKEPTS